MEQQRTVVRKVFFGTDSSREEQWLNDMAKAGYRLVSVRLGRYVFEDCLPREYCYRIYNRKHEVFDINESVGRLVSSFGSKNYYSKPDAYYRVHPYAGFAAMC